MDLSYDLKFRNCPKKKAEIEAHANSIRRAILLASGVKISVKIKLTSASENELNEMKIRRMKRLNGGNFR